MSHSRRPPGPPHRTIVTTELGGTEAEVQVREGKYYLLGPSGAKQELDSAEVEQLTRHTEDLTARAEERGLLLGEATAPSIPWLGGRREAVSTDKLTVLLDTTTIYNAGEALLARGQAPSPVALLDLSVFTAAATLFDTIVIQPEGLKPLADIRDLTQVLDPTSEGHQELETIYSQVWDSVSSPRDLASYLAKWAKFLKVAPKDLRIAVDAVPNLIREINLGYSSTADIANAIGFVDPSVGAPSLPTSGETLTIEESMTLRARTENAGHVADEHEWSWGSG